MLGIRKRELLREGELPEIGDKIRALGTIGTVEDYADGYIMWREDETGEHYLSRPGAYRVVADGKVNFADVSVGEFFAFMGRIGAVFIKSSEFFAFEVEARGTANGIVLHRITTRQIDLAGDDEVTLFDTVYVEEGE